jgi:hypothetical protein
MCHGHPPKSRYRAAPFLPKCSHADSHATNHAPPASPSKGQRNRHSRFRLRDGPILLQRNVIPAPDSVGRSAPPVGGRGQLARDSGVHCSYLLNTNSQNIVQCAVTTTTDVQKMTQAEDSNLQFSPNCIPYELPPRAFNVKGMYRFGTPPMRSTSAASAAALKFRRRMRGSISTMTKWRGNLQQYPSIAEVQPPFSIGRIPPNPPFARWARSSCLSGWPGRER